MLSLAQIERQNRLLRKLRIAVCVDCPECRGVQGNIDCYVCDGNGRITFEDRGTIQRLRDWWKALPTWKKANIVGMFAFFAGLILWLIGVNVSEHYWPI
jgi:hypothetical protein